MTVAVFKAETYRFLRLERPTDEEIAQGGGHPTGYVHLPAGTTAEWVKQLTAEQLVTRRDRRGFARLEWQQMRERNEALDCRIYARAAAWIAGLDRCSEQDWARLEAELDNSTARSPVASPPQPAKRRPWLDPPRERWFP